MHQRCLLSRNNLCHHLARPHITLLLKLLSRRASSFLRVNCNQRGRGSCLGPSPFNSPFRHGSRSYNTRPLLDNHLPTLDSRALLLFTTGAFKEEALRMRGNRATQWGSGLYFRRREVVERDHQNFQKSEKIISPGTEGATYLVHRFALKLSISIASFQVFGMTRLSRTSTTVASALPLHYQMARHYLPNNLERHHRTRAAVFDLNRRGVCTDYQHFRLHDCPVV